MSDTRTAVVRLEEEDYLTGEGVERLTGGGIAAGTLRNWRSAGKGPPFYRAGGRILYKRAEVREWIDGRRVVPELAA